MDAIQLVQFSLLTNITTQLSKHVLSDIKYIFLFVCLFLLYKIANICYNDLLYNEDFGYKFLKKYKDHFYEKLFFNDILESEIVIPTHKKKYFKCTASGTGKSETIRNIYTTRFLALNHFLKKNKYSEISSLVEIVNFGNDSYWKEGELEYMLFPLKDVKIKVCSSNNIWLEVFVESEITKNDNDKDNHTASSTKYNKSYVYKLTTKGKGNICKLEIFIEKLVDLYNAEVLNKKENNIIFEYKRSILDEDDNVKIIFDECPFKSNKDLEKNIFIENKKELIDYVNQFCTDNPIRDACYEEYKKTGFTYKASILLHGPPGTGKSSTINAILNKTKRIGIFVQWSKIKTCCEFVSLFRKLSINGKKYELKDVCYIFEDFDANENKVLKKRDTEAKTVSELSDVFLMVNSDSDTVEDDCNDEIEEQLHDSRLKSKYQKMIKGYKNKIKLLSSGVTTFNKPLDDGLTLDCVLNVLDGSIELEDSMMIFTTNHLEEIDAAFTRSGRINFKMYLNNASVCIIKQMLKQKFDLEDSDISKFDEEFCKMVDYIISPAEIQKLFYSYKKHQEKYRHEDILQCINQILEYMCKNQKTILDNKK